MERRTRRARKAMLAVSLATVAVLGACGSASDEGSPVVSALPGEDQADLTTTSPPTAAPTVTIARPFAGTIAAPAVTAAPPTAAPPTAPPPTAPPPVTTDAPLVTLARVPTTKDGKLPTPAPVPPERASEPRVLLGRIAIPKLGIDMDLWEGVTMTTLDRGPGHWPGTAMPGQAGNVVVAGHRVSHSRPFRYLDRLVEGDEVLFTVGGVQHRYVVTGHEIVPPTAVRIVEQTPEATATLFACHPPGSTRYRWVTYLKLAA